MVIEHGGYYNCNIIGRILAFLAFSSPNIVDIVLSIISYDGDIKKYYILRYVTQGICFIFTIFFVNYTLYEPYVKYPSHANLDGLGFMMILIICVYFLIPMEITCLVYFIRDYDSIESNGKIGYYIHLIIIPCTSIFLCYTKCNNSSYDDY